MNRRQLVAVDQLVDNSAGVEEIIGYTTTKAIRIYFEIQSAGTVYIGTNGSIQLKHEEEYLPIGFEFSNEGWMPYRPIRYRVPVGCKLLILEEFDKGQMQ